MLSWAGASEVRKRYQGYSGGRPDVLRMLPAGCRRILDVGCGAGANGDAVRAANPGCELVGIEPDSNLAIMAERSFDLILRGGIDAIDVCRRLRAMEKFDVVICADVLEHLVDPPSTVRFLHSVIAQNGILITSLPNVRHVSTFYNLGLKGRWPRRNRGIHDRTHLQFYARADILDLMINNGFILNSERRNLRLLEANPLSGFPARLLDFWPFRGFLTFQYLHRWSPE